MSDKVSLISLHIGRIKWSAPYANQYVVEVGRRTLTATAISTDSIGRRGGHVDSGSYYPGTSVLVAEVSYAERNSPAILAPHLILGSLYPFCKQSGSDFVAGEVVKDSNASVLKNRGYKEAIKSTQPSSPIRENRSMNRLLDSLPGEFAKTTALGGIHLLSEFMAKIGIAPDCAISFNEPELTAELISRNFVQDHLSYLREQVHRGDSQTDVEQFALNILEALGGNSSYKEVESEDGKVSIQEDSPDITGLFRHQIIRGGSSEGVLDTMRTDFSEGGPYTFGEHVYPGTLSVLQRMDGIYRIRAAKEIKLEKTFSIVSPWKKGEFSENTASEQDLSGTHSNVSDAERLQSQFTLDSIDDVYKLMPLLHDKFSSYEEANTYFSGLRQDSGIWYFPSIEEVKSKVFPSSESEKIKPLQKDEKEYTIDDLVSEDKELIPGKKVKVFKNSSVFLMSDDGGLVLGDGYGGEIRMNRGKVSISSIGDIEILPGRDLIEQVPGNRLNRTKGRVEISSTENSIAMKSAQNMQLLSGDSGDGLLLLENRATQKTLNIDDATNINQGSPYGSGILLKSTNSGISMLGSHIYGSGYSKESTTGIDGASDKGFESSSVGCDILFDAGNRSMVLTGQSANFSFRSLLSLGLLENATSLSLLGNEISMIAPSNIVAATSSFKIDRSNALLHTSEISRNGISDKGSNLAIPKTTLEVNGSILSRETIASKGQILSEQGVVSNLGANPEPIPLTAANRVSVTLSLPESGLSDYFEGNNSIIYSMTTSLYESMIQKGLATERGQQYASFAFPNSDSTVYSASNYSLISPRWQQLLDSSKTWEEIPVEHPLIGSDDASRQTYPYPGKIAFERSDTLILSTEEGIVKKGLKDYIINV